MLGVSTRTVSRRLSRNRGSWRSNWPISTRAEIRPSALSCMGRQDGVRACVEFPAAAASRSPDIIAESLIHQLLDEISDSGHTPEEVW